MHKHRNLEPGEQVGLHLAEGAELFCAHGLLRVTVATPWMADAAQARLLAAGQGWRAGQPTRITVQAEEASRYIVGQR